jgi:hypothetical protein
MTTGGAKSLDETHRIPSEIAYGSYQSGCELILWRVLLISMRPQSPTPLVYTSAHTLGGRPPATRLDGQVLVS